jgi:hypothetical protein
MPQNVWFWTNSIIGYGGLLVVILVFVITIIKKVKQSNTKLKNDNIDIPKINIDCKIDTADIAKMNTEQLNTKDVIKLLQN